MKNWIGAVLCVIALPTLAQAEPALPRAGVLTLEAQAGNEVPYDVAAITLVAESEGKDPAELAQRINRTLDETMKEAKADAKVTARSGGYRTSPTTDRDGRISTWRARGELILESRDFKALSTLAGKLSSRMQVAGITFALSPEARQAEEDGLIAQAIARFQARAQIAAKAFGYTRFSLLEVSVQSPNAGPVPPRPMFKSMAAAEAAPVPVEGGRTTVSVTVSGSVKLEKQ
ncbi:MAG TPA: SIMPL domain-containing protein [Burkholderiales bacterium]